MRFALRATLVVVLLPLLAKTLVAADATVQPSGKLGPPTDVAFKARIDGSQQRYVEMLPGGFDPAKSCDVLIALHGHGSDRWQYVRQERGECKAARDVAGERGMIFISPDYRAKTSWMGPVAEADLVEILGRLRKAYTIRKTFLVGGSMGGTGALTFAALHPNLVDGVCSQNPLASFLGYKVEAA
ncbi:MAG: alpha/beta fold hydrolase, partial [Planctomycetes bacterium]|nr:alpha/beta fold hydrolase [Planctomycetota bacterium]